jgi:menaquinone-dependent protoporphyrinogen oxidase
MSRVLVAYGTKHGATREIAEAIADEIKRAGHAVDCTAADAVRGVDDYDAAVIGSAVYMKRWRSDARRLLKRNAKAFASRPLWVFSSGPCGEKPDPRWSEPGKIVAQAEQTRRPRARRIRRPPAGRARQLHGASDGQRLPARASRSPELG